MSISRRAAGLAAAAGLALGGGCTTVPPLDRYLEQTPATPVQVRAAHGVLSHAESQRILEELRERSPQTSLFDRHVAIEQTLAGTPLSTGNSATLLQDGAATYAAMLAAIRAARHSIHVEVYIFEGGDVGREFADALVARRKAGVEVRVLYDGVGSIDTPPEFFGRLRDEGIEVAAFNPLSPGTVLTRGIALDHRDHRKLTVIDGRVAFVGGINISRVYGPAKRGPAGSMPSGGAASAGSGGRQARVQDDDPPFKERPWRDTEVRLEGPVVAQLQHLFLAQWARVRKEAPLEDARFFPKLSPAGHEVVRAIAGSPDEGADAAYVALLSAIESAETEVRITNAYFVPAQELRDALERAARRGVDVKLVLPSRSDNWLVLQAGHSYYEDLLEAGVQIYEREGRLLHAKTASIDGVWSTVGSTNLDWRSLAHNDELNVVVLGPDFAARMNAVFAADLANSAHITAEAWRHRPLADRFKELTARVWALCL